MEFKCKEKIAEFRGPVSCDGRVGVLGWMWEGGDAERDGGIGSGVPSEVCMCVCACENIGIQPQNTSEANLALKFPIFSYKSSFHLQEAMLCGIPNQTTHTIS